MAFVSPPVSFMDTPGNPKIPWENWKLIFENYMVASGASEYPVERKQAVLLHSLGAEGQRIFYSLPPPKAHEKVKIEKGTQVDKDCYELTLETLENHFKPVQNIIPGRLLFQRIKQLPGETVDEYLLALHQLIVPCKILSSEVEEEMIRDQLVKNSNIPKF